jgi:hypothetical protein
LGTNGLPGSRRQIKFAPRRQADEIKEGTDELYGGKKIKDPSCIITIGEGTDKGTIVIL